MKKFLKYILTALLILVVGGVVVASLKNITNDSSSSVSLPSTPNDKELVSKKSFYILEQYNDTNNESYELQLNAYQIGIDEYDQNWYCFYNYDVAYGCSYRIRIETVYLYSNDVSETKKTYSNDTYEYGWTGTGAFFYYAGESDPDTAVMKLLENDEEKIIKKFSNGLFFLDLEEPTYENTSSFEFEIGKRYRFDTTDKDLTAFLNVDPSIVLDIDVSDYKLVQGEYFSQFTDNDSYKTDKNYISFWYPGNRGIKYTNSEGQFNLQGDKLYNLIFEFTFDSYITERSEEINNFMSDVLSIYITEVDIPEHVTELEVGKRYRFDTRELDNQLLIESTDYNTYEVHISNFELIYADEGYEYTSTSLAVPYPYINIAWRGSRGIEIYTVDKMKYGFSQSYILSNNFAFEFTYNGLSGQEEGSYLNDNFLQFVYEVESDSVVKEHVTELVCGKKYMFDTRELDNEPLLTQTALINIYISNFELIYADSGYGHDTTSNTEEKIEFYNNGIQTISIRTFNERYIFNSTYLATNNIAFKFVFDRYDFNPNQTNYVNDILLTFIFEVAEIN